MSWTRTITAADDSGPWITTIGTAALLEAMSYRLRKTAGRVRSILIGVSIKSLLTWDRTSRTWRAPARWPAAFWGANSHQLHILTDCRGGHGAFLITEDTYTQHWHEDDCEKIQYFIETIIRHLKMCGASCYMPQQFTRAMTWNREGHVEATPDHFHIRSQLVSSILFAHRGCFRMPAILSSGTWKG